jgi:hypothetical protein
MMDSDRRRFGLDLDRAPTRRMIPVISALLDEVLPRLGDVATGVPLPRCTPAAVTGRAGGTVTGD